MSESLARIILYLKKLIEYTNRGMVKNVYQHLDESPFPTLVLEKMKEAGPWFVTLMLSSIRFESLDLVSLGLVT